jgi:hypothetical protein
LRFERGVELDGDEVVFFRLVRVSQDTAGLGGEQGGLGVHLVRQHGLGGILQGGLRVNEQEMTSGLDEFVRGRRREGGERNDHGRHVPTAAFDESIRQGETGLPVARLLSDLLLKFGDGS